LEENIKEEVLDLIKNYIPKELDFACYKWNIISRISKLIKKEVMPDVYNKLKTIYDDIEIINIETDEFLYDYKCHKIELKITKFIDSIDFDLDLFLEEIKIEIISYICNYLTHLSFKPEKLILKDEVFLEYGVCKRNDLKVDLMMDVF
jgi:hypothetical protein